MQEGRSTSLRMLLEEVGYRVQYINCVNGKCWAVISLWRTSSTLAVVHGYDNVLGELLDLYPSLTTMNKSTASRVTLGNKCQGGCVRAAHGWIQFNFTKMTLPDTKTQ